MGAEGFFSDAQTCPVNFVGVLTYFLYSEVTAFRSLNFFAAVEELLLLFVDIFLIGCVWAVSVLKDGKFGGRISPNV